MQEIREKLHAARRELAPNLILRGVPEVENEARAETEGKVRSLLEKMEMDHSGLLHIERVGKRLEGKSSRIIRVMTKGVQERNSILAKHRNLRLSPFLR